MTKAVKAKQLTFTLSNKVGLLSDLTCALTDAKVNIEAICAYAMEGKAHFMLITDNNAKAKTTIAKAMGAKAEASDVLCVEMPDRVGALEAVAKRFAEAGIDIHYLYGSTGTGRTATIVFKTADDRKALKILA